MNKITIYLLLFLTVCTSLFTACDEFDDNYSSNPNHRLSFSGDTLAFDTVFTTIGSTTKQFLIYNRHKEALNIERVLLANHDKTGFRMNLDGRKGVEFENIGILAEDSMYVFVEVTVNPNGVDQPLLLQDSIVFYVNGNMQRVLLEAVGQDVHLYKGGEIITEDKTFPADRPYLIYDSLTVAPEVKLTIEPGAQLHFHNKANLIVEGTLEAVGTPEKPIVFRGDRLDDILYDLLPYDRTPGQWGGIFFEVESFNNRMEYVMVRSGSTGLTLSSSNDEELKLKISNSQITNMYRSTFVAFNSRVEADNTEFSNAGQNLMLLMVGDYRFAHCTLANFMSLNPRDTKNPTPALIVTNYLSDDNYGRVDIQFDNCIIDGSQPVVADDPLSGEFFLSSNANGEFNYLFNHCVIKTYGEPDDHFPGSIVIGESLTYRMLGGKDNKYMYDFRIDSVEDAAVGNGDPEIAKRYPTDRYGVSRLTGFKVPTIGAYEFELIEEQEE